MGGQAFAGGGGTRPQGGANGATGAGGNFQGRNGGAAGGNFQGGNGGAGFGGRGGAGFNLFSVTRTLGLNPQSMVYINLGIAIIGILLLAWCAYGVWQQKKWALNLAMLLGLLFLLGALPGLFSGFNFGRFFNWMAGLRLGVNILEVIAGVVILVLGILPSVRDSYSQPVVQK